MRHERAVLLFPMNPPTPSSEEISRRAYEIWERRGRPDGEETAVDCWLQAERELLENAPPSTATSGASDERGAEKSRSSNRANKQRESSSDNDAPSDLASGDGVRITNMDTALPAPERRRAREARNPERHQPAERQQVDTFLVLLDRAHLRIFRATSGAPEEIHGADLPGGRRSYTDNDTDRAGSFSGSRTKGARAGAASIDERLPMQEEQERRLVRDAATLIENFLRENPHSRWHFSAGPALHQAVLDALSPSAHARLDTAIKKDLVNMPRGELASHFSLAIDETAGRLA